MATSDLPLKAKSALSPSELADAGALVRFLADSMSPEARRSDTQEHQVRMVYEQLLRTGWAGVYVYGRTPFARLRRYAAAARAARAAGRGIWRSCGGDPHRG